MMMIYQCISNYRYILGVIRVFVIFHKVCSISWSLRKSSIHLTFLVCPLPKSLSTKKRTNMQCKNERQFTYIFQTIWYPNIKLLSRRHSKFRFYVPQAIRRTPKQERSLSRWSHRIFPTKFLLFDLLPMSGSPRGPLESNAETGHRGTSSNWLLDLLHYRESKARSDRSAITRAS